MLYLLSSGRKVVDWERRILASSIWVDKYHPKKVSEILGNHKAKNTFLKWLKSWRPGSKAALLYGPPGSGKTTLVHVTADELAFRVLEMNASYVRTKKSITKIAEPAALESSLNAFIYGGRGTLIFFDEVDGIFGREDRGGTGAIIGLIKESQHPIVLAANDPWNPKLRTMRRYCQMIRFYGIQVRETVTLLHDICKKEKIVTTDSVLIQIAENSEGDVRSAINDLQMLSENGVITENELKGLSSRDKQKDSFETLKQIFSAENTQMARKAINESQLDFETLLISIHDNLPISFKDPKTLADSYDAISKADISFGRIKHTGEWKLLSYALEQMSIGLVPFNRKSSKNPRFKFPPLKFMMLGQTKRMRSLNSSICTLIGEKLHLSRKAVYREILPFLKIMINDSEFRSRLSSRFGLDEKMLSHIKNM